jgi:hypothetical protein
MRESRKVFQVKGDGGETGSDGEVLPFAMLGLTLSDCGFCEAVLLIIGTAGMSDYWHYDGNLCGLIERLDHSIAKAQVYWQDEMCAHVMERLLMRFKRWLDADLQRYSEQRVRSD